MIELRWVRITPDNKGDHWKAEQFTNLDGDRVALQFREKETDPMSLLAPRWSDWKDVYQERDTDGR